MAVAAFTGIAVGAQVAGPLRGCSSSTAMWQWRLRLSCTMTPPPAPLKGGEASPPALIWRSAHCPGPLPWCVQRASSGNGCEMGNNSSGIEDMGSVAVQGTNQRSCHLSSTHWSQEVGWGTQGASTRASPPFATGIWGCVQYPQRPAERRSGSLPSTGVHCHCCGL